MLIAAIGDTPYNIVWLLHIISVIVGTGAAFVLPMVASRSRAAGEPTTAVDGVTNAVLAPALLLTGVFGGALVGLSDDVYDFGQTWLAIAGVVWLIAVAAAAAAHPPSYVRLPELPIPKPALDGILHLSLAIMLVLMTWKWGV